MKTVRLYGDLAEKFGAEWKLDVLSPQESFRGIAANRPDFAAYIYQAAQRGEHYTIVAGEHPIDEESFFGPFSEREVLHVTPVIAGSKSGIASIIIGAAFIAAAVFMPALAAPIFSGATGFLSTVTWASVAFSIGGNLLLGGLASVLSPTPQSPEGGFQPGDTKPGYFFNGPTENRALGSAIPAGYGELLIGSQSISNGLNAEDMVTT